MRLRSIRDTAVELWREGRSDRLTGLAAELAFFGMLSFFPAFIAIAAALGSLESLIGADAAKELRDSVVSSLEQALTSEASSTIDAVEELFAEGNPGLLTFGLLGALWAMSRGFVAVISALDVVYDLEERRSYVRQRTLALLFSLFTVLVGAVMLVMIVVGPLLGSGADLADKLGFGDAFITFWNLLRWPATIAALVAWSTMLFHYAPNHRTPWRWDVPGAIATTAGWLAVTLGFRAYLAFASRTNQVFGSLGGALIVIVWLYLLAAAVLVGGEINAILAARHRVPQPGQD